MAYTPTPHQVEDSDAMLEYQHAFLWAGTGTGKTITAMEAFRKSGYEKLVILCPKNAISMWKEELQRHFGKDFYVLCLPTGRPPPRAWGASLLPNAIITTFDLARQHAKLLAEYAGGGRKRVASTDTANATSALIMDEAHMCKTRGAKRTVAILGKAVNGVDGLASKVNDVWQLTGTPIMRHSDDLWAQMRVQRAAVFKHYGVLEYADFVDEFCTVSMRRYGGGPLRKIVTGSKNGARLKRLLADCMVIQRRLEDVVANLPPVTHRTVAVSYAGVDNTDVNVATLIRDLADSTSPLATLRKKLGVVKAGEIAKYAADHATPPVLIGFWHKDVSTTLMEALKKLRPEWKIGVVDGTTPSKKRDQIKAEFNRGELDVILGQMQAMNTAWNLQEACAHVIIAEELLSPGMLHQFYSRVYRKGQLRHVQIDYMRTDHNIDIALRQICEKKAVVVKEVLA